MMQTTSHGSPLRRRRRQRACTERQKRKQKCIFRGDDSPCTNCAKRPPFPPVVCSINTLESPNHQYGERTLHISVLTTKSVATADKLYVRKSGSGSDSAELPPIANAEWLRADPDPDPDPNPNQQYQDPTGLHQTSRNVLVRSGSNLILDGRGDPSTLQPFGGILTEVNTLRSVPPRQTARNAELLHFYLRFVVPNLVSIDGESQPSVFLREVLPWQLQSPVFPNIGLLMASVTQSLDRGIELEQNPETFAMRARALSCLNRYIDAARRETFWTYAPEAVKCIINFVVMEWFWGSDESMRAHQRGMKEMIRLAGGLKTFAPVIAGITILTDFEISCGSETDLCWQDDGPTLSNSIPVPTTWTQGFDSPLIPSTVSFQTNMADLDISVAAAKILDDMRFLITSITNIPSEANSTPKILSTASWLLATLSRQPILADTEPSPFETDLITSTIHLTALLHTRSIATLTPISQLPAPSIAQLEELYTVMRKVSLGRWKKTPGIFLWIMLVLCPSSVGDKRGRFVRRKMAVTGLSIGFEDFPLGISYLRAFWLVQRWIERERERGKM